MQKRQSSSGWLRLLFSIVLFVLVLIVIMVATSNLSGGVHEEGLVATQQAIERAAVLCYATEGFYPPGISYIEERYGVQIDYDRYAVGYEIFASNIMPVIRVTSW